MTSSAVRKEEVEVLNSVGKVGLHRIQGAASAGFAKALRLWGATAMATAALMAGGPAFAQPPGAEVALGAEYVALGSSFAAGPGVAQRAEDSPPRCGQSTDNYAHILAQKRHLQLADRSCSTATTADILQGGRIMADAQIDAVGPQTQLVTVTTGGNDVAYIGNLYAWSCKLEPDRLSLPLQQAFCHDTPDTVVDERLIQLEGSMLSLVDAVHVRAPNAHLVFVDYATVMPKTGSCPGRLPLSDAQVERARVVASRLSRITADVARRRGATVIRASEITEGHDICSADPWVFGWEFPSSSTTFGPMAYHPMRPAMQAIADALDASLPAALSVLNGSR